MKNTLFLVVTAILLALNGAALAHGTVPSVGGTDNAGSLSRTAFQDNLSSFAALTGTPNTYSGKNDGNILVDQNADIGGNNLAAGKVAMSLHVGGHCEYLKYPGQAEIRSVTQSAEDTERYVVKFAFHPFSIVETGHSDYMDRQYELLLPDFSHPDQAFLDKHSIRPDKRIDAVMEVITRGTCTPVLFSFPELMPTVQD